MHGTITRALKMRLLEMGFPEVFYVGVSTEPFENIPVEPKHAGYRRQPLSPEHPSVTVMGAGPEAVYHWFHVFVASAPEGGDVYWQSDLLSSINSITLRWPLFDFVTA